MRWLRLLPLALMQLGVACVAQAPTSPAVRLQAQLDEDWRYWLDQYPEFATSVGAPGRHVRWTDYSPAAIDARATYVRDSLTRLKAIRRAGLSAADGLSYDLYLDLLEAAVEGLAFGNDALPFRGVTPHNLFAPMNQLEGLAQDVPLTISLMPARTVGDYEDLVARLGAVPALVDQTIALMERGLGEGRTPPAVTFRGVPNQVRAQIVTDALASPLLAAFRTMPAALAEPDRERLRAAAAGAYTTAVRPAFTRLYDYLQTRYLPACRETVGIDAVKDGSALYAYNVKWHTTLSRTPVEIHQLGLAEVRRIRAEMERVMAASGFTGGFEAFTRFLRTAPRFFYRDAASLLAGYRDIAKRADPGLAALFGVLPATPYGVLPVPDAVAPSQTTAYYQPGALAAGRPANMFANTYKLDARPTWEMEALTLHEAVPGHHLQIALAQELGGLPEFRKHSSYTAFVEGWALYAESLGDQMGFYTDPYSKFGQLSYEMWRAVRLVVDTGLHSRQWTRQEAIEFFATNSAKPLQDITVEIDRYIVWPGQALGYKMGQLKFLELRQDAERQLGAAFDIRRFHDLVLGQGAVPLHVLEQRVGDWVASGGS